jgi:hypothetical protein
MAFQIHFMTTLMSSWEFVSPVEYTWGYVMAKTEEISWSKIPKNTIGNPRAKLYKEYMYDSYIEVPDTAAM